MAVTGKTGADATYSAVKRIALIMAHYAPKFLAVVAVMESGGQINSAEAATIRGFVSSLNDLMAALSKIADYSGF